MRHFTDWLISALPYLWLWAMSFSYLVIDFFPQVSSLEAILSTTSFWILWLVFSFLNSIAFSLLSVSSLGHVRIIIPAPHLAMATVMLLSTVGLYSILQSFTVQFAGQKVIDIEQLVGRFRTETLKGALARKATLQREQARNLAGRLRDIYKNDVQALTEDYGQIMNLAQSKPGRVSADLALYAQTAGIERETMLTELVFRMALTDKDGVLRLLTRRRTNFRTPSE